MEFLQINIKINSALYLKDPESTVIGKRIVSKSIELLEGAGIDDFTFKKLGIAIGSPESTIYRYFDSKQNLLVYLTNWYWSWLEYKIVFGTANQASSKQKLKATIGILTAQFGNDNRFEHINGALLKKVVIAESIKIFHTKEIIKENEKGSFTVYKRIVERIAGMILKINPNYKYPHILASTLLEGINQQTYFVDHLPFISDKIRGKNRVLNFYVDLVFNALK